MANAVPNYPGQANGSGDTRALMLKLFGGEVLAAFLQKQRFLNKHRVKTLTSGKSYQFPALGRATAEVHTPGAEILGDSIPQNENIISIDQRVIAHVFVDELDEVLNHWDVRGPYGKELGQALAQRFDKNVARNIGLAARASNVVTGLPGGTVIDDADGDTDADSLAGSIFDAAQALDENDVPDEDRWCVLPPEQYYLLVESSSKAIHRDYGGEGSYADGSVIRIAGVPIFKSNNVPLTDESAETSIESAYRANFNTTVGFVWHTSAVGTVKAMDIRLNVDRDPRRLGNLMVASYAMGHGLLRPESAVEIRTGTPT